MVELLLAGWVECTMRRDSRDQIVGWTSWERSTLRFPGRRAVYVGGHRTRGWHYNAL